MRFTLRKALFAALPALCALAPSAWAGTVSVDGSTLTYTAAPGEANRVTRPPAPKTMPTAVAGSGPS